MTTAGGATGPASASPGLRERRRLERDLHDGAQQRLVALALTLRLAREKLDAEPGEAGRLLDRSRESFCSTGSGLSTCRGSRAIVLPTGWARLAASGFLVVSREDG